MRISALAQISCDVRYRRLQDKSPKIQGKTALWSWARSLTARTTPSATTLRRANMATLSSRVLSIRPRSCEPRCKMHPQWQGFLSPPRLWWRRNRSQRLLPCLQAAWATWTINRFIPETANWKATCIGWPFFKPCRKTPLFVERAYLEHLCHDRRRQKPAHLAGRSATPPSNGHECQP